MSDLYHLSGLKINGVDVKTFSVAIVERVAEAHGIPLAFLYSKRASRWNSPHRLPRRLRVCVCARQRIDTYPQEVAALREATAAYGRAVIDAMGLAPNSGDSTGST